MSDCTKPDLERTVPVDLNIRNIPSGYLRDRDQSWHNAATAFIARTRSEWTADDARYDAANRLVSTADIAGTDPKNTRLIGKREWRHQ